MTEQIFDIISRIFTMAWDTFTGVVFSMDGLWSFLLSMISIFLIYRFILSPIFSNGVDLNNEKRG